MQDFARQTPADLAQATRLGAMPHAGFIAGGTDLMQLWKNNVEPASLVVDLDGLGELRGIHATADGLRIGALATMAEVAAHPEVKRQLPAASDALLAAASPQIRNMGTAGGNLLQRTRCGYFRDTGFACNKRAPGSGCPAIEGENRELAIFGTSPHCIATHPSDFPVALVAARAQVEIRGADTTRTIDIAEFYRLPGDTPHIDTVLRPGDVVTAILVRTAPANMRSTYVKVRDRQSYAYALASVAAGIELQGGTIRDVRLAAGGVGAKPWRLDTVEDALRGKTLSPALIERASAHAADGAQPQSRNAFKVTLLQHTVRRALLAVTA